jgi:hypothetical protein
MEDAAGFFANVFGGERFRDYVSIFVFNYDMCSFWVQSKIGEISLMKEMTSVASTMMSEEEKAEVEKEMNIRNGSPSASAAAAPSVSGGPPHTPSPKTPPPAQQPATPPRPGAPHTEGKSHSGTSVITSPTTPGQNTPPEGSKISPKDRKRKLTPEQRAKLQEIEKERRKAMEERVSMLSTKLSERLRPYVEAAQPGAKDDPETLAFEAKIRKEADDLKLESFGVELLQAIGTVYIMKASSYMKSKKFLGM